MLTGKQRAYLRGLANDYDAIVHVGKGGISPAMIRQADDALTARELIKGRVLETAPLSAKDAAHDMAVAIKAEAVQVIGRTFILYRAREKDPEIKLPK